MKVLGLIRAEYLRGDTFGGLNADGRVPFPWWQDGHLIQEFIYPSQQIASILCLVRYVVKDLIQKEEGIRGETTLCLPLPVFDLNRGVFMTLDFWYRRRRVLTSSVMMVAIERPISWYC